MRGLTIPSTRRPVARPRGGGRRPLGSLLALGLAAGAIVTLGATATSGPPAAASYVQPAGTVTCTPAAVLDTWPLQKLADQTIVFPAEETDVPAAAGAAQAGYGGIILFGTTAPANLGTQLATMRDEVPGHLGLVVMTDEEGGGVQRMANLVGSMPWAAQMGATMTPSEIESLAESVGRKMLANGVGMDLAPVLDVDGRAVYPGQQDPDGFRSFSGNTSTVSADGVAFMQGMLAGGVVPVVKHFPGLGGVSQNTDYGPAWTLPWATLEKVALPPFEAAIKAEAPAVMVSNAMVRDLTTVPASLSVKVVTGELRDTLGFKGLIVTDSLSAGAIADPPLSLSVPNAAVEALEAGDDMILYGSTGSTAGDLSLAASASDAIVAAVSSGALPKSTLVDAVAQVLAAKKINLCPAAPLIGYLTTSGAFYVKEGSLTARWVEERTGVKEIALANGGTDGPLIGYLSTSGAFYAKEGSLTGSWVEQAADAKAVAVASDSVNGPLLGYLSTSGAFYVREGSLTAPWVEEETGAEAISLATDGTNGPLIGYVTTSGTFYAKEGDLHASWDRQATGVTAISLASDPQYGPLIGYVGAGGGFFAREGSLSSPSVEEETGARAISLATDRTNGPLIGYVTAAGAFYVKEGALRSPWVEEHTGAGAIALASDGINGPLIGYLNSSRDFYAKEGSLGALWVEEETGAQALSLAPT